MGLLPHSNKEFYLDSFTPPQFLVLAHESAIKLEWEVDFISEKGYIAWCKDDNFKRFSKIIFMIEAEKATIRSESNRGFLIAWGKNVRNLERFMDVLIDLKYEFKPEDLDRKYKELQPRMTLTDPEITRPIYHPQKKYLEFLFNLWPSDGFFITPLIIALNILVFIAMVSSGVGFLMPENESLLNWGANFRPLTLTGEWWRLLTNCFLHIGIFHLMMNMYALIYIGQILEPRIGKWRFLFSYLVSGIAASVTSLCWHEYTISAGASGAIFGMYGVYLILLITKLIDQTKRTSQLVSIGIFILYNLLYGMKGGIDNAAHFGGLLCGIVCGFSLYPSIVKPEMKLRNIFIGSAAVIGISALSIFSILRLSNPIGQYETILGQFVKTEERAMSLYRLPQNAAQDLYIKTIQQEGIPNWEVCRDLIQSLDSVENLPPELINRIKLIKKYCDYRITSFRMMAGSLERNTRFLDYPITYYNQKIELIIRRLNGESLADSLLTATPAQAFSPSVPSGTLLVVDGKPIEDIQEIRPETFQEVAFIKPDISFPLYGEKGKAGALIINTKKMLSR